MWNSSCAIPARACPRTVRRRAVDPFFTTKPVGQGTCLGLSMRFGYVRQSNGYLSIETEKGTAIIVLMLRYATEEQAVKDGQ
jgi:signal transduction histidine kinase